MQLLAKTFTEALSFRLAALQKLYYRLSKIDGCPSDGQTQWILSLKIIGRLSEKIRLSNSDLAQISRLLRSVSKFKESMQ